MVFNESINIISLYIDFISFAIYLTHSRKAQYWLFIDHHSEDAMIIRFIRYIFGDHYNHVDQNIINNYFLSTGYNVGSNRN